MKVKSWTKYFVYICIILIMVFWGHDVFEIIRENTEKTFEIRPFYTNIMMIIFYGSIGIVLGLDHLLSERNKKGKWKVNLPKIIFMVIPSLYFSCAIIIYCINNQIIHNIIAYPIGMLIYEDLKFIPVFEIVFGYSIITSFYKEEL